MNNGTTITLHPEFHHTLESPWTGRACEALDWEIPGQYLLARGKCPDTGRGFRQQLPYDQGYLAPVTILDDGEVRRPLGPDWYRQEVINALKARPHSPLEIVLRKSGPNGGVLLLVPCLRHNWGESLHQLFRITRLREPGRKIAVLISSLLLPYVPEDVDEIWEVRVSAGRSFTDLLSFRPEVDAFVKAQITRFDEVLLPMIHQPPWLARSEVQAFFKVAPFPREQWLERLAHGPVVTFFWSETRFGGTEPKTDWLHRLAEKRGWRRLRFLGRWIQARDQRRQARQIVACAKQLRSIFSNLDVGVVGFGKHGDFPAWIQDLRKQNFNANANLTITRRVAQSMVCIGAHGSLITPATALAGAVIELMPAEKLSEHLTNILWAEDDLRLSWYRFRSTPIDVNPTYLASIISTILVDYPLVEATYRIKESGPISAAKHLANQAMMRRRAEIISRLPAILDSQAYSP